MSAKSGTSGARQQRLTSYLDRLTEAAGHADRAVPLKLDCTGLLLPGERKSVEPMATRLAPDNVRRMHQSLHHVVAAYGFLVAERSRFSPSARDGHLGLSVPKLPLNFQPLGSHPSGTA